MFLRGTDGAGRWKRVALDETQAEGESVAQIMKSVWSFERPSPGSSPRGYIVLRFRAHRDGETSLYEGECMELEVTSFGETLDDALRSTMEATALYLETLDGLGEREKLFANKGIVIYPGDPGAELQVPMTGHPGEIVSAQRLSVLIPA